MVDDFRNYFSQVPVASEDLWKTVVAGYSTPHLADHLNPRIQFVAEYRLGFGIMINSNICQRLATFILHTFVTEFRLAELAHEASEPECVQQWLRHRRALSATTGRAEDTLFRAHIYTDDPIFMVIGVARTVRALRLWRSITQRYNLIMAIPAKRRLGTMVKWLGFLPSPMHGIIAVQRSKLMRASTTIIQALAGRLTVDGYRSLLGFLEHLKVLLDHPKRRMLGLYRPLLKGHEIGSGPATLVRMTVTIRETLNEWLVALATTAAAPVTYALPRARRPPIQGACVFFSSDASKEGTLTPGMAGYMHGTFWQLLYPAAWLWLPIAVLEFLALAITIIMFAPLLDKAPTIVIETDSLSAAFVLSADSARSPFITAAYTLLLRTPQYATLIAGSHSWRQVNVGHIYGPANVAADLLSRGDAVSFATFCVNLGVRPIPLPLSSAASKYIAAFFERIQPFLPLEMQGLGRSPASTAYDGPGSTSTSSDDSFFPPRKVFQVQAPAAVAAPLARSPSCERAPRPSAPPCAPLPSAASRSSAPRPVPRISAARYMPPLPVSDPYPPAEGISFPGRARLWLKDHAHELHDSSPPPYRPPPSPPEPSSPSAPPPPVTYALRPLAGYASVDEFRAHRSALILQAVPRGTRANERSSWNKWVEHCRVWGTTPWRDNLQSYSLSDDAAPAREELLTLAASFIEYCYLTMVPRAKGTHPKPSSAYKNWCDISRIHTREGLPKLDPAQLGRFVKALTLDYKSRYGFDALLERRKEPIRDAEFAHLMHLPDGTRLGPYTYQRHSRFGLTWRALHSVINNSGFRKAEWAVSRRGDSTLMTWAQLAWELNGQATRRALSAVQVALIAAGKVRAIAIIYPVPSKCDPDGSAFGNKGIPFPVDLRDDDAAGTLLLRLEQEVQPTSRRTTPLFSDEAGLPLLGYDMDRALNDALLLYDPHVAATRSWHSYRIRLASKLRAAQNRFGTPTYSDAVIQALLRWKTPASLAIYARYDSETYAKILHSVHDVDITSIQYANLPETSEFDRLDVLAATAESGLAAASSCARASRDVAAPAAALPRTRPAALDLAPLAPKRRRLSSPRPRAPSIVGHSPLPASSAVPSGPPAGPGLPCALHPVPPRRRLPRRTSDPRPPGYDPVLFFERKSTRRSPTARVRSAPTRLPRAAMTASRRPPVPPARSTPGAATRSRSSRR